MNDIKHLKCLASVNTMGAIRQLTPAAFPGNHCPMHTALSLGSRIKGVSTLVIGTAECGYYSRNVPISSPCAEQSLHWTYVLDQQEVIFGFRAGLTAALKEMDREGAKVILLLGTCVPELIGEDIESICLELQPRLSARLIPISLGNFKCGSYQPGYWKTLVAMGKLMKHEKKKTRTVNILGRSAYEDHIPMPELIKALKDREIPLRFIAPDSCLEDFVQAANGQLNLVLSPFMYPLAQWMEKEHKIPFFSLHDVYDVNEISLVYSDIAQFLKLDNSLGSGEIFDPAALRNAAESIQKEASKQLSGIQYVSALIGAVQPLPLSVYLSSLGMIPIMIHMEEFYPADKQYREALLYLDQNPVICLMLNEQADQPLIEALCPALILGDWGGRTLPSPASIQLMDFYGQIGYERTILLLERILKSLDIAFKYGLKNGGYHNGTL